MELGHKERVRTLENQLKSLGEEPNARAKKSSSGSDSEFEWQSGLESKLKEAETSLQQEKEQRQKIENELQQLKATAAKLNKTAEVRIREQNFNNYNVRTLILRKRHFLLPYLLSLQIVSE